MYKVVTPAFQSTPLREGRQSRLDDETRHFGYFNPRPSVRGDFVAPRIIDLMDAFQSTPLREGRQCTLREQSTRSAFQSTPLREGRRVVQLLHPRVCRHFNPRPSVRGDARFTAIATMFADFNPRPSVRGDVSCNERARQKHYFNPRPSVRGDPRQNDF